MDVLKRTVNKLKWDKMDYFFLVLILFWFAMFVNNLATVEYNTPKEFVIGKTGGTIAVAKGDEVFDVWDSQGNYMGRYGVTTKGFFSSQIFYGYDRSELIKLDGE